MGMLQFKFRPHIYVSHSLKSLLFPVLGRWSFVLCIWTGHNRCSLLDGYRTTRSQERASWSNSTSLFCCDICLYPFRVRRVKQMELPFCKPIVQYVPCLLRLLCCRSEHLAHQSNSVMSVLY